MRNILLIPLLMMALGAFPALVSAADETDVYNCNRTSGTASAGSTEPRGGPFVPVADYTVELNTGLLVYKECVLRVLVAQKRKSLTAQFDERALKQINQGRTDPTDPNVKTPYFVRLYGREMDNLVENGMVKAIQGSVLSPIHDTLEASVKTAVARSHIRAQRVSETLKCPYAGNLPDLYRGTPSSFWTGLSAIQYPTCNLMGATLEAQAELNNRSAFATYEETQKLNWGQGTYPVEITDEYGNRITVTPGAMVLANGILHTQSSYDQLKNADDIGQLVNGLYAGITNQMMTTSGSGSTGGLASLTQSLGGAASYMQNVVLGTGADYTRTSATIAIGIMQEGITRENSYRSVYSQIAAYLIQKADQLRSEEKQCFVDIKSALCESGSITETSCTASGGGTLTFTGASGFANKAIDGGNIPALRTEVTTRQNSAQTNIAQMGALIADVAANPSPANQAAKLAVFYALPPHSAADVQTAQSTQSTISTTLNTYLEDTIQTKWKENTDSAIGWCNVSNQTVLDRWKACWSGNTSQCITP